MRRFMLLIFLSVAVLVCAAALSPGADAAEIIASGGYEYNDTVTWTLDTDGVLTISGSGDLYYNSTVLGGPWLRYKNQIRKLVIEKGIEDIGIEAFSCCVNLTSVSLPEGFTSIQDQAFSNCTSLKEISFQSDLYYIGYRAFENCSSLEEAIFTGESLYIRDDAFINCSSLSEVSFPNVLEALGSYAFWGCTSLKSVSIPSGLKSAGNNVFSTLSLSELHLENIKTLLDYTLLTSEPGGTYRLYIKGKEVNELSFPKGTTEIRANAFYGCSSIESVTFPTSVKSIKEYAFYDCASLASVTIPSSVNEIGLCAFAGCRSLVSFNVASGNSVYSSTDNFLLSKYGDVLYNCPAGKSGEVKVPEGVVSVRDYAFCGCSQITSVIMPQSVTTVGENIYYGCTSMGIENNGSCGNNVNWILGTDGILTIRGKGTVEKAKFEPRAKIKAVVIEDGVEGIGEGAFASCSHAVSVVIPDSVTVIGRLPFPLSLERIEISDLAVWYGIDFDPTWCAVANDSNYPLTMQYALVVGGETVKELRIPETFTGIGKGMFSHCSSITSVVIPDTVTVIGAGAFSYCSSLASVSISNSISSIEGGTFQNCSALTAVSIPASVTIIGDSAFRSCSSLGEVYLPETVTTIGKYAFRECSSLKYINIPKSISSISDFAFQNCESLSWVLYSEDFETLEELSDFIWRVSKDSGRNPYLWGAKRLFIGNPNGHDFRLGSGFCSGSCGDSLSYVYDPETGALTISGSGEMWKDVARMPWLIFADSIRSVSLPEDLKGVNDSPFAGCSLLRTAGPAGGGYDIEYRWKKTVPDNAFAGADGLESIVLPDTLLKLSDGAFRGCSSLKSLRIPENVESIGENVLDGCASLDSVGEYGSGCALEISWREPFLGALVQGSGIIKTVIIPEGVEEISSGLCSGCTALTTIFVPASVSAIGENAFAECEGITRVYYAGNEEAWGNIDIVSGNDYLTAAEIICNSDANTALNPPPPPIASGADEDGIISWTLYADGLFTVSGAGDMQTAFSNKPWNKFNDKILTVVIEEGITALCNNCFSNCADLTSVTLPESLESISVNAFRSCTSLEEINLPFSLKSVGMAAFRGCSSLTDISIPGSVIEIGLGAFADCRSLVSIDVDPGNTVYSGEDGLLLSKDGCVLRCCPAGKSGEVTVPSTVVSIADLAFSGCSLLKSVSMPAAVTDVGKDAFNGCGNIAIKYYGTCGENLNWILDENGVLTVSGAGSMEENGFVYEDRIKTVVIEDGVTGIMASAFCGCPAITSVKIPATVRQIGANAFPASLKRIDITDLAAWCAMEKTGFGTAGEQDGGGEGCAHIAYALYLNGEEVADVTVSDSVESVPNDAFAGCISLKSVVISDGVSFIGERAFLNCSSLESVFIPSSVRELRYGAFMGCASLNSINITDLTVWCAVNFDPSWCDHSYDLAMNGETVTELRVPETIEGIESFAFTYCSSIVSADIPATVTAVKDGAFSDCSSLAYVCVPGSVVKIGSGAFSDCTALQTAVLQEGVTALGEGAFSGCAALTDVYLPSSLKSVGEKAFFNCEELRNVYYTADEEAWGDIDVAFGNGYLTTAEIIYNCDPNYVPPEADLVTVYIAVNESGVKEAAAAIYCRAGADVTAMGALYGEDGRFMGVVTVKLTPGQENEVMIPVGEAQIVRIFAVDGAGVCPVMDAACVAVE